MKTRKSIIIMLSSLMCFVLSFAVCAEDARIMGDMSGDGRITASDARAALRFSARLDKLSDEAVTAADVNYDGDITAADARIILRAAAQIEEIPPKPDGETTNLGEPKSEGTASDEHGAKEPRTEAPKDEKPYLPPKLEAFINDVYTMKCTVQYEEEGLDLSEIPVDMDDFVYTLICNGENVLTTIDVYDISFSMLMNGTNFYIVSIPDMTYALFSDELLDSVEIENFNAGDTGYTVSVAQGTENGEEYTIYTIKFEYQIITAYMQGDEPKIIDVEVDGGMSIRYNIISLEPSVDEYLLMIDNYTETDIYTMFDSIFGDYDFDDDDYYWEEPAYYNDEFWVNNLDWSEADEIQITAKEDMPDEYYLLSSDRMSVSYYESERITVEYDGEIEYFYDINSHSYCFTPDSTRVYSDGFEDKSLLRTKSTTLLGKEKTVYYLIDDSGCYTEPGVLMEYQYGIDEEFLDYLTSVSGLLKDGEHTVSVKRMTLDSIDYLLIICRYDDGTVAQYTFENGVPIRSDEYAPDGTLERSKIIYDFSVDFDESVLSLDSLKRLTETEFIRKCGG